VSTGAARGFYDRDWAALRSAYLAEHPWCWCGKRATEVDHIIPVRMGGPRLSWFNLRSLCHTHHSQVTALTMARTHPPRTFRKPR
jgi:hypothetical protein